MTDRAVGEAPPLVGRRDDGLDGEIAPWRLDLERHVVRGIDRLAHALVVHWLLLANTAVGVFSALPVLSPLLAASGHTGLAGLIHRFYSLTCHQLPHRSFSLFRYQMAYCQRDFAIYTTVFLCGLLFVLVRRRLRPLDWRVYLVLILPMAVDGTTQLLGWRESTWQLRVVTGTLFGFASVWLAFPHLEVAANELRSLWSEDPG